MLSCMRTATAIHLTPEVREQLVRYARGRSGTFANVPSLIDAIMAYIAAHNQDPTPFVWSAPVERILARIAKCKEALGTLH